LDVDFSRLHPEARAGRYLLLTVSDTGLGMSEETRHHIFEPFFTTKETGQGTGLGLTMVHGIVTQSGGHVAVYSEPGYGTTFKIYLPVIAETAAAVTALPVTSVRGGEETILVVEDQAEVRNYAVEVLKEYGYRVSQAENAAMALALWEREPGGFDIVLTDLVMPRMSGRELATRLKNLRAGIKVLFMSGYSDDVIGHRGALERGAQFIQKPFSREEIGTKVRSMLDAVPARVLVVDDERPVRSFLREALEQSGYEVSEASDGREVLRQVHTGQVDLVVTDLVMPEKEGIETILALRRSLPGVGIIAVSGARGGRYLDLAKMAGADMVLDKPVSPDLLKSAAAEVLKRRSKTRDDRG